jgi:hypothetical protein
VNTKYDMNWHEWTRITLINHFRYHNIINDKYAIATMKNKICVVMCDGQRQGLIGENTVTTATKVAFSKLTSMLSIILYKYFLWYVICYIILSFIEVCRKSSVE